MTKDEKINDLQDQLALAVFACRLVHEAARSGGLYVTRDSTKRDAASRALGAVRAVLGIAPTAEALPRGDQ